MATKQLDRLLFAQGGRCFFCERTLPKADASVEHLFAKASGGNNDEGNCVACCKAINALFGSMSVKRKFEVVLKQKGLFKCPNGHDAPKPVTHPHAEGSAAQQSDPKVEQVIANLKWRGNAKPRTLPKLAATIVSIFPKDCTEAEVQSLIEAMQSRRNIAVQDGKVTYLI